MIFGRMTWAARTLFVVVMAVGLWLPGIVQSHASTIANLQYDFPPTIQLQTTGLPYNWRVTMNGNDSATYQRYVSGASWIDPARPTNDPYGPHAGDWTALDLTESATLTVILAPTGTQIDNQAPGFPGGVYAAGLLTPTMRLYQGWGDETAVLNQEPNPFNLSSITKTFALAAGRYTLSFSSSTTDNRLSGGGCDFNFPCFLDYGRHGYSATLSTTSPVPLPAAAWLFGSGVAGLAAWARRRTTASLPWS